MSFVTTVSARRRQAGRRSPGVLWDNGPLNRLLDTPAYFLVLGLVCGLVGSRMGWRLGQRHLFSLIQGLLGFVVFAGAWRATGPGAAALALGGWAVGVTLFDCFAFRGRPETVDRLVLKAWARGPASRPLRAVVAHLRRVVVFVFLAFLTANLASIVFGALMLNAMNARVANLSIRAGDQRLIRLLGWSAWYLLRVVAYILLGTAAAEPMAAFLGYSGGTDAARTLLAAGTVAVALDLTLNLLLSRRVSHRLAQAREPDPPLEENG